jgi:hypothetical protein
MVLLFLRILKQAYNITYDKEIYKAAFKSKIIFHFKSEKQIRIIIEKQ